MANVKTLNTNAFFDKMIFDIEKNLDEDRVKTRVNETAKKILDGIPDKHKINGGFNVPWIQEMVDSLMAYIIFEKDNGTACNVPPLAPLMAAIEKIDDHGLGFYWTPCPACSILIPGISRLMPPKVTGHPMPRPRTPADIFATCPFCHASL